MMDHDAESTNLNNKGAPLTGPEPFFVNGTFTTRKIIKIEMKKGGLHGETSMV